MRKRTIQIGFIGIAAGLVLGNATVFALPIKQPIHSPTPVTTVPVPSDSGGSGSSGTGTPASPQPTPKPVPVTGQPSLTTPQQQTCQSRATAINAIMSRADTRTQNQITLFGIIATRVENFYTSKSKTVTSYDQLIAAIASAKTQATADLTAMQAASTIDCNGSDPKGTVTTFQTDLKTASTDLQKYRSAVESLITAVASANGVTVSASQGGQQ